MTTNSQLVKEIIKQKNNQQFLKKEQKALVLDKVHNQTEIYIVMLNGQNMYVFKDKKELFTLV